MHLVLSIILQQLLHLLVYRMRRLARLLLVTVLPLQKVAIRLSARGE